MKTIAPIAIALLVVGCVEKNSPQPQEDTPADPNGEVNATAEPVLFVANGLNADGSLVKNYHRGLQYAIDYFGNYGPYYVYLLGPDSEQSVREIYRQRAMTRINPGSRFPTAEEQVEKFLNLPNVAAEIKSVLSGKAEGGLTWTQESPILYEDVTTNAKGREKDPVENTWGALHEYHHVFQMAHCDTKQERTSEKNINSWMAEGMATYSSAKFMDNLGLVDFQDYMLELRKSGANIARPGINEFLIATQDWQLDNESYWDQGRSAQVYYMLGAWATAYLIHVQNIDESVVLKKWYHDIPQIGKSAAFEKHMGLSLAEFYQKFDTFIRQTDDEIMVIFP
ncbi:MAG: hypothetical protein GY899_13595 [Verrucomicrobiaceae bacterium]|nr:hypothetical protein [Verrucomicrobiaceae bacterium]